MKENFLASGLFHAAAMLWEMLWALVLGFGISAALQVFVGKEKMVNAFGKNRLGEILLAMGLGAASSSCSYAAAATTKTVFKKGAAFMPSLAFMIASTNLVVELGIVLWILLGWRFVLAEFVGAFVMVALIWVIFALHPPRKLIAEARKQTGDDGNECDHYSAPAGMKPRLLQVADAFVMDWSMLWKEILLGVLIAGFLMELVPRQGWQVLFVSHGTPTLRLFENAFVGPLIAMASFVCSIGNIPLAGLLFSGGASFGGVIAFLYGDLIVLPLIAAYRKYYGGKMAAYITLVLFAGMVGAGILVDLLFQSLGLISPAREGMPPMIMQSGFSWNYTTWLDIAALLVAGGLLYQHFQDENGAARPCAVEHEPQTDH